MSRAILLSYVFLSLLIQPGSVPPWPASMHTVLSPSLLRESFPALALMPKVSTRRAAILAKIICVCVFFKMVLYLYSAKIRKFAIIYTFQTLVRSDKRRNLIKGRHLLGVGLLALFISVTVPGISQDVRRQRRGQKQTFSQAVAYNKDSIPPLSDSLKALKDSLHIADSLLSVLLFPLQKIRS